jgi:hypothetical protein
MKLLDLRFLLLLPASAVFLSGQNQNPNRTITNADIVAMSRAGVPESTILTDIQSGSVKFDVSPEGLIALHEGGVSETVMNQMIRASSKPKPRTFGVATGTFPVRVAAGKTVHYGVWIKTDNVADGYAGLWWRVDGKDKQILAFDNSQARIIDGVPSDDKAVRGATGTTAWKHYEFELPVSTEARNINFGLLFNGTGTAWFDGLSIQLDGVPYTDPQLFDLDFESPAPKGFFTGGEGYSVKLDNTTAWSGAQSLKMTAAAAAR